MCEAWYIRYYRERFVEEYEPFDEAVTAAQVDFVERVLGLKARARVLDLACGWGRHSRLLARRGHEVVGLDLNHTFLCSARETGTDDVRWVCGNMRHLPFVGGRFDAVICLWNSFGYFDDSGNSETIWEISRVLAEGGRVMLDLPNRDFLVNYGVLGRDWERDGHSYVLRSRQLDSATGVLRNDTTVLGPDGSSREYQMRIRCYTLPEIRQLLATSGLVTDGGAYGEYDVSQQLSVNSYQMIVVAQKQERALWAHAHQGN